MPVNAMSPALELVERICILKCEVMTGIMNYLLSLLSHRRDSLPKSAINSSVDGNMNYITIVLTEECQSNYKE